MSKKQPKLGLPPLPDLNLDDQAVPLAWLVPGQVGVIDRLEVADEDAARLKSMGVCAGRRILVDKPGDPLVLRVLGSRLGVSARLAEHVYVHACPATATHPQAMPPSTDTATQAGGGS